MRKCAFLVYKPIKNRRKEDTFDAQSNIGAYMLIDAAKRGGVDIEFCTPESAKEYDIVLISMTSVFDIYAFVKAVYQYKHWHKRNFIAIVGGYGVQNVNAIIPLIDYAWYGRAENEIVSLLSNIPDYQHRSLLDVRNIKPVYVNQTSELYPHEFNIGTKIHGGYLYKEQILGCHNQCFYCHYTFARKYIKTKDNLYSLQMYSSSQELEVSNKKAYNPEIKNLVYAIDGYSDRLRYIYNRKNKQKDIDEFIIYTTNACQKSSIFHRVYNITGMETETEEDEREFIEHIISLENGINKKCYIVIHNTPLHPSLLTPVMYSPVNIDSKSRHKVGKPIYEGEKLKIMVSWGSESNYTLLQSVVVERAKQPFEDVFINMIYNRKLHQLSVDDKMRAIKNKWDLTQYIREYDIDEEHPAWYVRGYIAQDKVRLYRKIMKKRMLEAKK
jgi:hypothetical protein